MTVYNLTRAQLKERRASEFAHGDAIHCGKYWIRIAYGSSGNPSLHSTVELFDSGKSVPCWPAGVRGCWPYYIDDFMR